MLKKDWNRCARAAATWSCKGEPGFGKGWSGERQRCFGQTGSRPSPNGNGGRDEAEDGAGAAAGAEAADDAGAVVVAAAAMFLAIRDLDGLVFRKLFDALL